MKLKISQFLDRGGRDYMEDFSFSHIEERNGKVIFGIFGIFDGHGGSEAAEFVQKTLKDELIKIDKFWSNDNLEILESIKLVYSKLQKLMWIEREKWIRTISGYKSTAGSTASIVIIRNGVLYTGHVGDSGIVLLHTNSSNIMQSTDLTTEHKPDNPVEKQRIEESGGCLRRKFGIERVVWNRKRLCDNYTGVDKIPFLAVARSLGDLWSYDFTTDCYHVSPEPDVQFLTLDANSHRAIIIGSDGLWNVLGRDMCVKLISLSNQTNTDPARLLVRYCLNKWKEKNVKADNVSAVVITLSFESDSTISHQSESLDPDLFSLYDDLLSNKILDSSCESPDNRIESVLDDFSDATDFRLHLSQHDSTESSDIDLMKRFLTSHSDLASSVCGWTDEYWSTFVEELRTNFGLASFSRMMYHIETCTLTHLSRALAAFPWSMCFRKLMCDSQSSSCQSLPMYNQIQKYLTNQPLLSQFWVDFYTYMIDQNKQPQWTDITTLRNSLIDSWGDIRLWLMLHVPAGFLDAGSIQQQPLAIGDRTPMQLGTNDESHVDTRRFSVRKSNTYTEPAVLLDLFDRHDERAVAVSQTPSSNVFRCYQLRRSVSHDVKHSNLDSLMFGSGSSTPMMSISPDCDRSSPVSSAEPDRLKPVPHIGRTQSKSHFVSLPPCSLKRQSAMSNATAAKIILISKSDNNTSPSKLVKKFALTRQKRFIL